MKYLSENEYKIYNNSKKFVMCSLKQNGCKADIR